MKNATKANRKQSKKTKKVKREILKCFMLLISRRYVLELRVSIFDRVDSKEDRLQMLLLKEK